MPIAIPVIPYNPNANQYFGGDWRKSSRFFNPNASLYTTKQPSNQFGQKLWGKGQNTWGANGWGANGWGPNGWGPQQWQSQCEPTREEVRQYGKRGQFDARVNKSNGDVKDLTYNSKRLSVTASEKPNSEGVYTIIEKDKKGKSKIHEVDAKDENSLVRAGFQNHNGTWVKRTSDGSFLSLNDPYNLTINKPGESSPIKMGVNPQGQVYGSMYGRTTQ